MYVCNIMKALGIMEMILCTMYSENIEFKRYCSFSLMIHSETQLYLGYSYVFYSKLIQATQHIKRRGLF